MGGVSLVDALKLIGSGHILIAAVEIVGKVDEVMIVVNRLLIMSKALLPISLASISRTKELIIGDSGIITGTKEVA